jgi:hypothetical protein
VISRHRDRWRHVLWVWVNITLIGHARREMAVTLW